MNGRDWYRRRDNRQLQYAGRILPHDRPILVRLEPEFGGRYDGQVAAIVAANLLSRMSPNVAFDFPELSVVNGLPWAQARLGTLAVEIARAADPYGNFTIRSAEPDDYILSLGRTKTPSTVHGSGWGSFIGPGGSNLPTSEALNPIGPALAVILAAARLFGHELKSLDGPYAFDAFSWSERIPSCDGPFPKHLNLGQVWSVGVGSVGTAALYFLVMATRQFRSVSIDLDNVTVENLDRSPIFTADDAKDERPKAKVVERFLRGVGVAAAEGVVEALDLSSIWMERRPGTPDLVIAAANERNVRYLIEQCCPPLQIYATTGKNWNVAAFRHIPFVDPCSCCAFPPSDSVATMTCAEGKVYFPDEGREVDAALPFLSFGAGLMAAAEVLKAQLPGYAQSPSRTFLSVSPQMPPSFVSVPVTRRMSCVCGTRSETVHALMINRTRYAAMSGLEGS